LKNIIDRLEGFELSLDGYIEIEHGTCGQELRDTETWVENLWQIANASVPIPSAAKR
jgi:hypothetical protein